jgi:hypothetical protein
MVLACGPKGYHILSVFSEHIYPMSSPTPQPVASYAALIMANNGADITADGLQGIISAANVDAIAWTCSGRWLIGESAQNEEVAICAKTPLQLDVLLEWS